MRVACLLISNLAVQVALADEPGFRGRSLIIGGQPFEKKPVYDASPEAASYGVRVGMPLRETQALCPEAVFRNPDEKRYKQVFEEVLDTADDFSPLVDVERPGCAYLYIDGVRDERGLTCDLAAAVLSRTGLVSCIGVAGGKFFSLAAAHVSSPESPVVVAPGEEERFIASFPIDFIDCPSEMRECLLLLGIRFIGQLRGFGREALISQFGGEGDRLHQLAHGIDRTPLMPRKRAEVVSASCAFESPADSASTILESCRAMLQGLVDEIQDRGKLCREVSVKVSLDSMLSQETRLHLKEATRSEKKILTRVRTWLETAGLPAPATGVEISLWLTGETAKKIPLCSAAGDGRPQLGQIAGQLRRRFGYQPLKRVREIDPDAIIPERRFGLSDVSE